MVSAIDCGLDDGIHIDTPGLKALGKRLAAVASGHPAPDLASVAFEPDQGWLRVSFDHVQGGLQARRAAPPALPCATPPGNELPLIYKVALDGPDALLKITDPARLPGAHPLVRLWPGPLLQHHRCRRRRRPCIRPIVAMMNRVPFLILCLLTVLSAVLVRSHLAKGADAPGSLPLIEADSNNIQYVGRFDFTDPKKPRVWAPGAYVQARFRGTACAVVVNDEVRYGNSITTSRSP